MFPLLVIAAGLGGFFLGSKQGTSSAGPGRKAWGASTFTQVTRPDKLPPAPLGPPGSYAVVQDTGHGGPNGALIVVQIVNPLGSGSVVAVVEPSQAAGASPIQTADQASFRPSDVLFAGNYETMLTAIANA